MRLPLLDLNVHFLYVFIIICNINGIWIERQSIFSPDIPRNSKSKVVTEIALI